MCACGVWCSVGVVWLVDIVELMGCEHIASEELSFVVVFVACVFSARVAKSVFLVVDEVKVLGEDCGLFVVVWDLLRKFLNGVLPCFLRVVP